jgi:hypothetical protein
MHIRSSIRDEGEEREEKERGRSARLPRKRPTTARYHVNPREQATALGLSSNPKPGRSKSSRSPAHSARTAHIIIMIYRGWRPGHKAQA